MDDYLHIVVVGGEITQRQRLVNYLARQNFRVSGVDGGTALRELVQRELPALVLLDVELPGEDGLALARWLREKSGRIGIIIVTAAAGTVDRVLGLETADDYITKPFEPRELLARVKSVLRRASGVAVVTAGSRVRMGRRVLDLVKRVLVNPVDGSEETLTASEFDLLKVFAEHPNRPLQRDWLLEVTAHREMEAFDRAIDLRITRLRRKIELDPAHPDAIRTVRGVGYMFVPSRVDIDPKLREAGSQPKAAAFDAPDKPSIAVLPFENMSGDPEQEFVSDGIAEDVITALSRYPSLFVIARNSSYTYKGRALDVKQVGRELGVRYVLEGSVRKAASRIRVTAQLIETRTANHIWAERYDRPLADIFAVQDEITHALTTALAPAIAEAERVRAMRKPPDSLDAWAAYQRGLWHLSKATHGDDAIAEQFFRQAIDFDPNFAGCHSALALVHLQAAAIYQKLDLVEAQISAEALARRAVALDGADAEARSCLGWALQARGDHEGALAEIERALAMSPNLATAHGLRGATLIFAGRPREGLTAIESCIRLDPRDPFLAVRLLHAASALYLCRDYEATIEAAKRLIRAYPDFPMIYRWSAAALGQLGRSAEAKDALGKAIALAPAAFEMYVRKRVPWFRPEDHAHLLEGLRKAGWEG